MKKPMFFVYPWWEAHWALAWQLWTIIFVLFLIFSIGRVIVSFSMATIRCFRLQLLVGYWIARLTTKTCRRLPCDKRLPTILTYFGNFDFCLRSFSPFVWLNMLLLPPVRHLNKGINVNDSAPLWNSSITLPTLRASLFPYGTRAVRKKTQKRSQSIFIENDRKQEKRSEWAL